MDILDEIAQARRDAADHRSSRLHSLIRRKSRRPLRQLFLILLVISLGTAACYYNDDIAPLFWRVHARVTRKITGTHWTGFSTGSGRPSFFSADEMTPAELFARASPAVVTVHSYGPGIETQGSGFFVSDDGLLVTNYHVVADADEAVIVLADGTRADVRGIAAASEEWDIAILRVDHRPNVFLKLKQNVPDVGTHVFAIGSPEGFANSLSEGLVSGIRADGIQVTAPISHGSSGGPLLDAHEDVLGVTTFKIAGGENLNFAVPSARVVTLMASIAPTRPLPAAEAIAQPQRQGDVVQHPPSPPTLTELSDAFLQARSAFQLATDSALTRVRKTPRYLATAAERENRLSVLEAARRGSDRQAKLVASSAFVKVNEAINQLEADAISSDADVRAAQLRLESAEAALADARRTQATAAAAAPPTIASRVSAAIAQHTLADGMTIAQAEKSLSLEFMPSNEENSDGQDYIAIADRRQIPFRFLPGGFTAGGQIVGIQYKLHVKDGVVTYWSKSGFSLDPGTAAVGDSRSR